LTQKADDSGDLVGPTGMPSIQQRHFENALTILTHGDIIFPSPSSPITEIIYGKLMGATAGAAGIGINFCCIVRDH